MNARIYKLKAYHSKNFYIIFRFELKADINAKQIRQSIITNWLKTNNLGQVQYMVGHKYVGSTERYQGNNIESLLIRVEKCHPLQ